MHTSQSPNIPLSALGGGEGRGEVGGAVSSDRRHDPPHPPTPFGVGPSLSPRKRAERGKKRRNHTALEMCAYPRAKAGGPGQPVAVLQPWIPAFAGTTNKFLIFLDSFRVRLSIENDD